MNKNDIKVNVIWPASFVNFVAVLPAGQYKTDYVCYADQSLVLVIGVNKIIHCIHFGAKI